MGTSDVTPVRTALHRFGLARDSLRTALARATGLAPSDLDALEHLEADGPLTPKALAHRLQLTSGGATVLADRLERAGLVRRRPHPHDRRSLLLELDPSADVAEPEALAAYHTAISTAARSLSPDERDIVTRFLSSAADAAQTATTTLRKRSTTP